MRRLGTDEWSGIAVLVVVIGIAAPILTGIIDTAIPAGWWALLFAAYAIGLALPLLDLGPAVVRHAAFVVAVLAGWALVATAPGMGLLMALLVVTAALSVYIYPLPVGLGLVLANTAVIALAVSQLGSPVVEIALITGFYLLIQVATVLSTATLLREKAMREELAVAHAELKAASVLLEESARTSERLRISRDLHDQVGHHLTVLALELEAARHRDGDAARAHVERAGDLARDLLGEVRATVGELRDRTPDLREALEAMTADIPGLRVDLRVGAPLRTGEDAAAALLRVAQEVLTNALRHSGATTLRLRVDQQDGVTVLDAQDDGHGADTSDLALGHGLRGLRERVEALGGDVALDGSDGFRVTARVPAG